MVVAEEGGGQEGCPRPGRGLVDDNMSPMGLLNVIDRNLLGPAGATAAVAVAVAVLVELEAAITVLVGTEGVRLVNLGGVGQLAVRLAEEVLTI